jgi:hypothetical protein
VFTTDISQLYAEKLKLSNINDHVILPEVVSKEPLGPLVRHGDDQWFDVVKWTHFAMLNAEELGVGSKREITYPSHRKTPPSRRREIFGSAASPVAFGVGVLH